MTERYIGVNNQIRKIKTYYIIENGKPVEIAPVVHGRWEPILEEVWNLPTPVCVGWRCSVCGRDEQNKEPYCNCGARMDGDAEHD